MIVNPLQMSKQQVPSTVSTPQIQATSSSSSNNSPSEVSQFLATYSKSNSGLFLEPALNKESSLYPAPLLTKSP